MVFVHIYACMLSKEHFSRRRVQLCAEQRGIIVFGFSCFDTKIKRHAKITRYRTRLRFKRQKEQKKKETGKKKRKKENLLLDTHSERT